MIYGILGDLVVVLHLAYVVFAVAGGFLLFWRPRLIWIHLPAAAWAAIVELCGWICPLTPLENHLRKAAGLSGYGEGFIAHYLIPVLYPQHLTRPFQIMSGLGVVFLNLLVYGFLLSRRKKSPPRGTP
jgi:Protein of Unknown function (DUF2784)